MNVCFNIDAGGIFSKMMFYFQNSVDFDLDKVYLNCTDSRAVVDGMNPFDFIFLQPELDESFLIKNCQNILAHSYSNKIENSVYMDAYKNALKKISLNNEMIKIFQKHKSIILENMSGVHIRLTDMNELHPEYGTHSFEDYRNVISELPGKVFVASDNKESINKLVSEFGEKIVYIENNFRAENENDNIFQMQLDNFSNKNFWQESFLEMYLLSLCKTIVCKTSNLTNTAKIFATKKQEYIWI
jgi:hypothetical protein